MGPGARPIGAAGGSARAGRRPIRVSPVCADVCATSNSAGLACRAVALADANTLTSMRWASAPKSKPV